MGNDAESWMLCSDGSLRHNKEELHHITQLPQEGDTVVSKMNTSFYRSLQSLFYTGSKL